MTDGTTGILGTARMVIHEGRLEEFKRLVSQCIEVVRTQNSGAVRYDFFPSSDGTECFVHERCRHSAAGVEHMANIEPLARQLAKVCNTTAEVCGSPSPQLRAALESAGVTIYEPVASR